MMIVDPHEIFSVPTTTVSYVKEERFF